MEPFEISFNIQYVMHSMQNQQAPVAPKFRIIFKT